MRPITGVAWLKRTTLNSIKQKSLLIEIDQDFLAQIQKILPASLAGFCVWTGAHAPEIWVKWHWYFDEELKQFVVPARGIESNVSLLAADSQLAQPLPHDDLVRFVLRRIRRRHDWRPWLQLRELRRTPRGALPAKAPPIIRSTPSPAPGHGLDPPDEIRWEPDDIELIRLMKQGSQRKQIAAALRISTATVDRRLANIKKRMGVSSTVALLNAADWHGLI